MIPLFFCEELLERLQAFSHLLNTFDFCLQFIMDIGGRSSHFLDLEIALLDNKLETSIYSKPTDAHISQCQFITPEISNTWYC